MSFGLLDLRFVQFKVKEPLGVRDLRLGYDVD